MIHSFVDAEIHSFIFFISCCTQFEPWKNYRSKCFIMQWSFSLGEAGKYLHTFLMCYIYILLGKFSRRRLLTHSWAQSKLRSSAFVRVKHLIALSTSAPICAGSLSLPAAHTNKSGGLESECMWKSEYLCIGVCTCLSVCMGWGISLWKAAYTAMSKTMGPVSHFSRITMKHLAKWHQAFLHSAVWKPAIQRTARVCLWPLPFVS